MTRRVADRLALFVHEPHGTVGSDDPVVEGMLTAVADRCPLGRIHPGLVVGVDACEERVGRPGDRARLDAKDPVQLVRPLRQSRHEVPFPAPDVGDPLGLGQVALAPAESLFEPRPLLLDRDPLGDVLGRADIPDRRTSRVADDHGLLVEKPHGAVGSNDPVLGGFGVAGGEVRQTRCSLAPIIRMDEPEERFDRPRERARLDPQDPV